ncbi:hypothetical protein BD310DRAFT_9548 [Dichomitus squalens]|uniref:Uncharacterized protein n=1 Tax=Dichomitus squalens TaxID=114155 RepID=A0A4Q9QF39_9APHY|nr:hypothetical protein BD310DRAFT_9548 [Dichomitus squalens]
MSSPHAGSGKLHCSTFARTWSMWRACKITAMLLLERSRSGSNRSTISSPARLTVLCAGVCVATPSPCSKVAHAYFFSSRLFTTSIMYVMWLNASARLVWESIRSPD